MSVVMELHTHLSSCDAHIRSTIIGRTLPPQEVSLLFHEKKNLSLLRFFSDGGGGLQVCEQEGCRRR